MKIVQSVKEFVRLESASSILLLAATILALIIKNSPFESLYDSLLTLTFEVRLDKLQFEKPLLLWINDGLMAIFFLLVGLELKREVMTGELSNPRRIVLPIFGAVGGMAAPALIYTFFNLGDETALKGWALASATDIAFALGLLAAFGKRVPTALKVFLLTIAIVDDLGAIVIIALFYSSSLKGSAFAIAAFIIGVLFILNRRNVESVSTYALLGAILWAAVLKSGVHATLAGVVLAMFIPMKSKDGGKSPLSKLEHDLHPTVAFGILPVFAFANAGIPLDGVTLSSLLEPLPLGIALALFFGNQIGIFTMCMIAKSLRLGEIPQGVNLKQVYATGIICGIGFTMSLFIGSLAFEGANAEYSTFMRIGIIGGSLLSAVVGALVLNLVLPKAEHAPATATAVTQAKAA